jgi:Tricorn protease C1 domain
MFDNAWRLERDFFYSTAMNGVNWNTVHDSYRKLLPLAGSRDDVNYLKGWAPGQLAEQLQSPDSRHHRAARNGDALAEGRTCSRVAMNGCLWSEGGGSPALGWVNRQREEPNM